MSAYSSGTDGLCVAVTRKDLSRAGHRQGVRSGIRFTNGQTIRVPTFSAPAPLEHIRFYATELSESVISPDPKSAPVSLAPKWLAGLDNEGSIVACLVPAKAKDGMSPLADCR